MTETTKRILELQKQRGIKNYPLEKAAGLPVSTIQSWINGKKQKDGSITPTSPSAEAIIKLARYFNVSADYLLCLIDDPKSLENREIGEVSHNVPAIVCQIPNLFNEQRFINTAKIYNELPDEYRERAFGLIMGIAVGLGLNVDKILRR